MKSFNNQSLSKLDPSAKMSVIINRRPSNEKSRLIEVELKPKQALTNEILVYAEIKVEQSGFYNISNQLSIHCNKATHADVLQFGVCDKAYVEFSKCFNSVMIHSNIDEGDNLTNNLSSITYLSSDIEYIGWLNFQSADNPSFDFSKDYSSIRLIKL